jgi:glycogen operon protein
MTDEEWNKSYARCLGMYLEGHATGEDDDRGQPVTDDDFVLLLNCHHEPIAFVLSSLPAGTSWRVVIDTSQPQSGGTEKPGLPSGEKFPLQARSLVLLVRQNGAEARADSRTQAAHRIPQGADATADAGANLPAATNLPAAAAKG